jgi:hypothetical protein
MSDARVTDIVDRVPNTYNTDERWVVKKIRSEYVNRGQKMKGQPDGEVQ